MLTFEARSNPLEVRLPTQADEDRIDLAAVYESATGIPKPSAAEGANRLLITQV